MIRDKLYPACLPKLEEKMIHGIHSGWSTPPPLEYVQSVAPLYKPYFRDFSKQRHYRMENVECKDPTSLANYTYKAPSNTYYPPGVLCAQEMNRQLCPTSGASGSPLMIENHDDSERFTVQGILSFIKGCTVYGFGRFNEFVVPDLNNLLSTETKSQSNVAIQLAENPLVYTKIFCYLPWIAKQFDLDYDQHGDRDSACVLGSGNPDDLTDNDKSCSNTPSSLQEVFKGVEQPCIFPYYVDGRLINDTCFKVNPDQFLDPVSRCPVWNITTKINGINSYNTSDTRMIFGGYCFNEDGVMDPETKCPLTKRFPPFSKCKNNCRGGNM